MNDHQHILKRELKTRNLHPLWIGISPIPLARAPRHELTNRVSDEFTIEKKFLLLFLDNTHGTGQDTSRCWLSLVQGVSGVPGDPSLY